LRGDLSDRPSKHSERLKGEKTANENDQDKSQVLLSLHRGARVPPKRAFQLADFCM